MEIITKYFKQLSAEQSNQLAALDDLYHQWNARINVISRKDIDELYLRHVLHSLAIAKVISFTSGTKILDVGCGGGFPGIPLAILFPKVNFTLVDSIGKKITVVNEVAKALELKNVTGLHERAEKLNDRYDFIISRAVTAFPAFVHLTRHLVSQHQRNALPNGIIYLKGGDFQEEIAPFGKSVEVINIPDFFDEAFFETKKVIYLPL
ncbi:MAG: 16S rRNA (guanine(527)-N(7))-methyltransferase RsmG [Prolixibacteraceae bacterium]|nr:16S rRNA (guanine(527)-N(7))-methyltransferase RsmG [Prolixibacteraceae bacterium]